MDPRSHPEPSTRLEANRLAARAIEGLPLAERTISLADVSTVVLEGGEGPPMVLLHGQGGFGAFMGGMAAQAVDRYRVVYPTFPDWDGPDRQRPS